MENILEYKRGVSHAGGSTMEFKTGDKAIVARALDHDEYYYGCSTDSLPLKTQVVVLHSDHNSIIAKLPNGTEFRFHPNELRKIGAPSDWIIMPNQYIIDISSKTPTAIINDRMYVIDEEEDRSLDKNFLRINNTKYKVTESASLKSLEELTYTHNIKEFDNIESMFLEGIVEEGKEIITKTGKDYILMDFIVNEVFPYFRGSGDEGRVASLLGEKVQHEEKKIEKKKTISSKKARHLEDYISKITEKIAKEKLSQPKKTIRQRKKLDDILGHNEIDLNIKDYYPESVFGNIIGGKNAAIIEGTFYRLIEDEGMDEDTLLNIDGKEYIFLAPENLSPIKERYYFELSKLLRINTLKKLYNQQSLIELMQNDSEIEDLVNMDEYSERDFGFIKKGGQSNPYYYLFLKVPEHVLRDPELGYYHHFRGSRVAVKLYLNSSGEVSYEGPMMVERRSHPFSSNTNEYAGICMGNYERSKLNRLKRGEAVARLLTDAKHTLLSGYIDSDTGPERRLCKYTRNKISLEEIERKGLQITNVNLLHRRRRRR